MREEPLPQVLRRRRRAPAEPAEPPGLDGLEPTDEAAEPMPDLGIAPHPRAQFPFMLDAGDTYQLHIAVLESRRQFRPRGLPRLGDRLGDRLLLAAMGLPLVAMLLDLLWSILSGRQWWADDPHASPWKGFVGGDW